MASVEVFGSYCAKTTSYNGLHGVGWCGNNLSRSELAGYLSGLSDIATDFGFAKYSLDTNAERLLTSKVAHYACLLSAKENWHIIKGRNVLHKMAELAVYEVLFNRCDKCFGRLCVNNKVCSRCKGTGYKKFSGREKSEYIGINEKSYRQLWKARYEAIFMYVISIDVQVGWRMHVANREKIRMAC